MPSPDELNKGDEKRFARRVASSLLQGQIRRFMHWLIPAIVLGTVANVAFALLTTDVDALEAVQRSAPYAFGLAAALALVPWITDTIHTVIWVRFVGAKVSVVECYKLVLATQLAASLTPTAAGGGYLKMALLTRYGISPGSAVSLVFLHTIEHMVVAAIAVPAALTISNSWDLPVVTTVLHFIRLRITALGLWAIPILAASVLLLRVLWRIGRKKRRFKRVTRKIATFLERLRRDFVGVYVLIAKRGKLRFAITVTSTAIGDICRFALVLPLFVGFSIPIDPVRDWLLQWVVFVATTMVPMPGGAGGAEAMFYLIYGSFVPREILGFVTASWRFLSFYTVLISGGLIFTVLSLRRSAPHHLAAPSNDAGSQHGQRTADSGDSRSKTSSSEKPS